MNDHEQSLTRRLAARDLAVLDDLIAAYSGPVHRLAAQIIGRLGSPEDVEEAAGDAFATAWKQAAEFDPDRTSLKAWLLMLTKYTALERRRRLQRQRYRPDGEPRVMPLEAIPEPVEPSTPEEQLLQADRQLLVREAMAKLPDADRELLTRRYYFEEPIEELARELGLSRSGIDNRLWRARMALKSLLHKEEAIPHGRSAI